MRKILPWALVFLVVLAGITVISLSESYPKLLKGTVTIPPTPNSKFSQFRDFLKPHINEKEGVPNFIHFWATWCTPCLKELPQLAELSKKYQDSVNFVLFQLDDQPWPASLKKYRSSFKKNIVIELPEWEDFLKGIPGTAISSKDKLYFSVMGTEAYDSLAWYFLFRDILKYESSLR